jgi:ferric-dicitrate binding protein FerR (iron transport regulator)
VRPFEPKSEDDAARAITGLADGEVSEAERQAVEAWVAQRPDVESQVANDRHIAQALRETGPDASSVLIAAIEARAERAYAPRERGLRLRPALAALAVTAAALALVVGITLGGGSSPNSPAGVAAAAKLAFSPATQPAPVAKTAT